MERMKNEPNPAPITIALRARAAETGSGTSLAILLRNAGEVIESLRAECEGLRRTALVSVADLLDSSGDMELEGAARWLRSKAEGGDDGGRG